MSDDVEIDADKYLKSKNFKGTLILNWKSGSMRVVKREVFKATPYEISMKININVSVPKIKPVEIKGDFEIPMTKVKEAMIHDI